MNRIITALLLASLAAPAMADGKNKGPKHGNGYGQAAAHCPPGLAKKNPPCVPPDRQRVAPIMWATISATVGCWCPIRGDMAFRTPHVLARRRRRVSR